MNITTKPVEYFDGKQKCIGYMAWDESIVSERPCVLVSHAWDGLGGFAQNQAVQMAALGYVGFALDNYGDGLLPEGPEACGEAMMGLKQDRKVLLKRLLAGMKAAQALDVVDADNVAIMGFCFGGTCALDLARSGADIKAAISFHGLLDAPDLPKKKVKAKVLVAHGWDDPMASPEALVDLGLELTTAKCDFQLLAMGQTTHSFTNPEAKSDDNSFNYNAVSAQRSMNCAFSLLDEVFGMHGVDVA